MELEQFRIFGGTRKFELISPKQLKVTFSTLSRKSIELVDLYNLESKYERIVYRELKWLAAAVISALIGIKFIYDAIIFPDSLPIRAAVLFISVSIVLILIYYSRYHDQIIFRIYQSDDPGLIVWATKPSEEKCFAFVDKLVEAIKKLRINPNLSPSQKLEIYAQSLSFLCDQGVISEKEAEQIYERASRKMIKNKGENIVSLVK